MNISIENYIKNIYKLQISDEKIGTRKLSELLDVKMPSVTEMIHKLTKMKLVVNEPYYGFRLTAKGKRQAINLIRKHRILEYFMKAELGYKWSEVHEEAEILEHAVSTKFINKLDKYLNFPITDPHGKPIPNLRGNYRKLKKSQI